MSLSYLIEFSHSLQNKVSAICPVAVKMVKELVPDKPKCLNQFDPTMFNPDWGTQGKRNRTAMYNNAYMEV